MINKNVAVITGIEGMDAAHLSKFLLDKGYKVVGFSRRSGSSTGWRLIELGINDHPNLIKEYVDITEYHNVLSAIEKWKPELLFNLAAMSFVKTSFDQPFLTNDVNYIGLLNLISAIKIHSPKTKLYQASTSEMFGEVLETPQSETTPFNPVSPYGISKLSSYYAIKLARKEGIFACSGILFNHESPLRGEEFVTRKITKKVAEIKYCLENNLSFTPLVLGNMDAKRDWSYAGDMVEGMWLMFQYNKPDDYVLCSGDCYMVREFVDYAFYYAGIPIAWEGKGIDEKVVIRDFFGSSSNGSVLVEVSPEFFRPAEVDILIGDCTKAKEILNWKPKYSFSMLVESMVKADIERTKSKKIIIRDDCE